MTDNGRANGNGNGHHQRRRVVVTGIGAIAPIWMEQEGLWRGLRAQKSAVTSLTRFDPAQLLIGTVAQNGKLAITFATRLSRSPRNRHPRVRVRERGIGHRRQSANRLREPTAESLSEALARVLTRSWDAARLLAHAELFAEPVFVAQLRSVADAAIAKHRTGIRTVASST